MRTTSMRAKQPRFVLVLLAALPLACAGEADSDPAPPVTEQPDDDSVLQALAETCIGGVFEACDELWNVSPVGSDFERIGATCGNRLAVDDGSPFGNCVEIADQLPDGTVVAPRTTRSDPAGGSAAPTVDGSELLVEPALGTWVVIAASLSANAEGAEERAIAEANRLRTEQRLDAAVFATDRFPSLNPGFWVVYVDSFEDPDAASSRCTELLEQGRLDDCYHRLVSDRPAQ